MAATGSKSALSLLKEVDARMADHLDLIASLDDDGWGLWTSKEPADNVQTQLSPGRRQLPEQPNAPVAALPLPPLVLPPTQGLSTNPTLSTTARMLADVQAASDTTLLLLQSTSAMASKYAVGALHENNGGLSQAATDIGSSKLLEHRCDDNFLGNWLVTGLAEDQEMLPVGVATHQGAGAGEALLAFVEELSKEEQLRFAGTEAPRQIGKIDMVASDFQRTRSIIGNGTFPHDDVASSAASSSVFGNMGKPNGAHHEEGRSTAFSITSGSAAADDRSFMSFVDRLASGRRDAGAISNLRDVEALLDQRPPVPPPRKHVDAGVDEIKLGPPIARRQTPVKRNEHLPQQGEAESSSMSSSAAEIIDHGGVSARDRQRRRAAISRRNFTETSPHTSSSSSPLPQSVPLPDSFSSSSLVSAVGGSSDSSHSADRSAARDILSEGGATQGTYDAEMHDAALSGFLLGGRAHVGALADRHTIDWWEEEEQFKPQTNLASSQLHPIEKTQVYRYDPLAWTRGALEWTKAGLVPATSTRHSAFEQQAPGRALRGKKVVPQLPETTGRKTTSTQTSDVPPSGHADRRELSCDEVPRSCLPTKASVDKAVRVGARWAVKNEAASHERASAAAALRASQLRACTRRSIAQAEARRVREEARQASAAAQAAAALQAAEERRRGKVLRSALSNARQGRQHAPSSGAGRAAKEKTVTRHRNVGRASAVEASTPEEPPSQNTGKPMKHGVEPPLSDVVRLLYERVLERTVKQAQLDLLRQTRSQALLRTSNR